jgi:RND superfamily putative drug exporter
MLQRLSDLLFRRRRAVLATFFVLFGLAGALGGPVATILSSDDDFEDPAAEAIVARDHLAAATGASPTPDVIALAPRARLDEAQAALRDPAVARVQRGGASEDGEQAFAVGFFKHGADRDAAVERLTAAAPEGVTLGGGAIANVQASEQVSEDLARAEMLAFPILFLLSLVVFRGLIAALLPLAVGITTILTTFTLIRGVNEIEPMSVFALNLIIGLGLGLAIDYSLFIVSRFREEMHAQGNHVRAALSTTMRTAGRTVFFSSITVAAAAASLIVFPQRFLFSMGIGGALVALIGMVVALTLLPALLAVLGRRIGLPREVRDRGFWYRLSHGVMRRPGRVAVATAAILVLAGLPFARIEFTGVDAQVLPPTHSARAVDDALRADFSPNASQPVLLAVDAPASAEAEVTAYAQQLAALPGAAPVEPAVQRAGELWAVTLAAAGGPLSDSARDYVEAVRAAPAPFDVQVGGQTAEFVDSQASLGSHLPIALGILAATTLVILFLMTGSVVLPIKTLLMNVLTLSAAFGALVLVFQDGRLEGLLDFTSQGALESSQPILLFAIAFGLSTDYGVFLLTRIKEHRDAGASDSEAVALGLQRTGRIVTFAALLFVIAIGAFVTSEMIFIKELGFGTAVAVAVDATIVRALLVPALMRLLGRWNWWAPKPLARFHARFGIREGAALA